MKAKGRESGPSSLRGGDDEPALFDRDAHLLVSRESGSLDPSAGELDPGVKLGWLMEA